jgi:hypothetical protein
MIYQVKCNACKGVIVHDLKQLTGCLCDSDAPTWVGIGKDGRLIHYSQLDVTVIEYPE